MNNILVTLGKLRAAYKWGGLFGLLFLMLLIYYFVVFVPHQEKMKNMVSEYNAKKAQFSKMVVMVGDRGRYLEEIESLNRELKVAVSMLPDKKEIPSLLKKVSDEAEKYGLNVYFFQPKGERRRDFYAEVPVDIKVKGTFHEMLSFFDAVQKLSRIVNIDNVSMKVVNRKKEPKPAENKGFSSLFERSQTELDVSFAATTYRFLSPEELESKNKKGGKSGKKK